MDELHLPQDAASILERTYNSDARTSEFDKWLIYTTYHAPQDAQKLYRLAMSAYNEQALNEPESEWESVGFLKPANQSRPDLRSPSLQRILEHHLHMVERQFPEFAPDGGDDEQFYVFGFIALTQPDWKHKGATAVHCDKDRGKWKVTQCRGIPIDQLGMELTSVSDNDDDFDNVRVRYDDSGNEGPDNQGGAAPHGQWQFLVYSTNLSQLEAMRCIPDPRGGPDFPLGEATFMFRPSELSSIAEIQEDLPIAYAETVRNPTVPATGSKRISKVHPGLFVVVEGKENLSIKIVKLDWDHNIQKSDAELKRIGRESQTISQWLVEPEAVVSTLERLATEVLQATEPSLSSELHKRSEIDHRDCGVNLKDQPTSF
ncbi:hypothetical protein KCU85_g8719, partial [Aureobasidium melanogenum]